MKQKISLSESALKTIIKESVKRVLNEISSDMIGRARKKFYERYGGTDFPGPDAKDFPRDEHGNLLYPKDMKPLATHYDKFHDAYKKAKKEEEMEDPIYRKAHELVQDVDWEKEIDDIDGGGAFGYVYGEIEDENGETWKFTADASFEWEGDWAISDLQSIEFEAPDGTTGVLQS